MKWKAVFLAGRNTFFRFEVENNDDGYEEVEEDMRQFAKNMGVTFLYLESLDD